MEDISDAEKQRRQKYRDHDLSIDDLTQVDFAMIKNAAIKNFIETRRSDNAELIIESFMGFLTSKGFRIIKKESKQ